MARTLTDSTIPAGVTLTAQAASAPHQVWLPWARARCSAAAGGAAHEECSGLLSPMQSVPSALLPPAQRYDYGDAQHGTAVPLAALLDDRSDTAVSLSVAPAPNLIQVTGLAMVVGPGSVGASFGAGYRVSS